MIEGVPKEEKQVEFNESMLAVARSLQKNPTDLTLLREFLETEHARLAPGESDLELNIKLAKIYQKAGMNEEAHRAFRDAAEQAWEEKRELYPNLVLESYKYINPPADWQKNKIPYSSAWENEN